MRFIKTFWIFLVIAVFIASGITLYMLYQGQVSEQEQKNISLSAVNMELIRLNNEKGALEEQITQLEADISIQEDEADQLVIEISQLETELSQLEDERAQAEAQALLLLSQAEAKFLSSVESIEYNEILLSFARYANIELKTIA